LRTAADAAKDQTYFLFGLDHAALRRTLFPVGDLTKPEVRAEAAALGLPVAAKPESMEVCFVPRGDAAGFVERHAEPGTLRPGVVVDEDGRVVGGHEGVHRFTVGQRRGLGLGGGPRRYVRAIDAAAATVTIAPVAHLSAGGLVARGTVWAAGAPPAIGAELAVRIRHRHRPVAARLTALAGDTSTVRFVERGPTVTPGQAAVFYRRDLVVGGGWIVGETERDVA
jgi:tRNA-specific 2-thiouridylase